jgi:hypothetical protein
MYLITLQPTLPLGPDFEPIYEFIKLRPVVNYAPGVKLSPKDEVIPLFFSLFF